MKSVAMISLLGLLLPLLGWGISLQRFASNGTHAGGFYWLDDPRLVQSAEWVFEDVPSRAEFVLTLEVLGYGPCGPYPERNLYLRLFYGSPGCTPWYALDMVMEAVGKEGEYTVYRGEKDLNWAAPAGCGTLAFKLVRMLPCDPHVGVNRASLHLGRKETHRAPPSPQEPKPHVPVVVKPVTPCISVPEVSCVHDGEELGRLGLAIRRISLTERVELPDTFSPSDAVTLGPGHYLGELGAILNRYGMQDNQDWYKIALKPRQAAVAYFEPLGSLFYHVFITDPCGIVLTDISGGPASVCVAPCGEENCTYMLHIVRTRGEGKYLLSLFFVEPCR